MIELISVLLGIFCFIFIFAFGDEILIRFSELAALSSIILLVILGLFLIFAPIALNYNDFTGDKIPTKIEMTAKEFRNICSPIIDKK